MSGEVEKLKSQHSEAESTLPADKELASEMDGGCAAQAPECVELQRLRAEGLVAVPDTIKLLNDYDSLELPKEILTSPSLMQLQSDRRGVARRARTVVRKSPGSPGEELVSLFQQKHTNGDDKKMYCSTNVDRTEGEVKSLAIDIKSHESVSAAKTPQQPKHTAAQAMATTTEERRRRERGERQSRKREGKKGSKRKMPGRERDGGRKRG